jgi:tungstate transport system ATP-binding protein
MNAYTLAAVVKRYGARTVLHVDDLAIRRGECTAIVGPSGAGKSTLLRLLNFLEPPDEGRLEFEGKPVGRHWPTLEARRRTTMVFQRPLLLNGPVLQNVTCGLWLRGRRERALAEEMLDRVKLLHLRDAPATTLSGGEAQRVALARALVIQPDVLLLDEPTANLDPANVAIFEEILQELRGGSTTIIVVTHNLFQARRLSDSMVLLLEGRLVEAGPTEALAMRPRDPRTRDYFSGAMIY